jgi:hypothetical protein
MNLKQTIRRILREQTESGGGIFYHNSDYDINSFNTQINKDKRTNYLFFSNEPNTFIDRKYTYKVKLQFDPNKIFNTFKHINDYGIKYTLEDYKDEVLELFEDNLSYFLNEWEKTGVDSINEVMEYYIDAGGDEDDMVGLLYYFLTKFNDSWAILETDKFLDFIESKGFNGFVTHEEGLINIACKDFKSIEILGKKEMWSDDGEGVKSLKEDSNRKLLAFQKLIDKSIDGMKKDCELDSIDDRNISIDTCDFLEALVEAKVVDITSDNTIQIVIKYSYLRYIDENQFIYELKHELKKYGNVKIDVIDSINIHNRQW